jgi:S-adenosyl methyltransferase
MVSMLHFVPGDEAYHAVGVLGDALAPGSYLVISHPISEAIDEDTASKVAAVYQRTTTPGGLRTRAGVERFFNGFELVEPGLVWVPQWHRDTEPSPDESRINMVAGVALKRE